MGGLRVQSIVPDASGAPRCILELVFSLLVPASRCFWSAGVYPRASFPFLCCRPDAFGAPRCIPELVFPFLCLPLLLPQKKSHLTGRSPLDCDSLGLLQSREWGKSRKERPQTLQIVLHVSVFDVFPVSQKMTENMCFLSPVCLSEFSPIPWTVAGLASHNIIVPI